MLQALSQCASLVGEETYFVFCFSLLQFIDNFLVYSETIRNVTKVMEIFKKCGKILALENQRRNYRKELKKY